MALGTDENFEVVGVWGDFRTNPDSIHRAQPDLVIVEESLLGDRGLDALRADLPNLKLIVLSPEATRSSLTNAARDGAVGVVTTDKHPSELTEAVKRVLAGEVLFSAQQLISLLARPPRLAAPSHTDQPLTPREVEVLQALVTGASTDEIANQLGLTEHTVRTYVKSASSKLKASSKLEATVIALRRGLIELSR